MPLSRKPFEELTITDDFMFGAVMSDPKRCKRLLEKILNIRIARIEYPERQKAMDFSYDSKSVRLDIYVEDENNTVYNIEMQTAVKGSLPLRIRYYHDMIDLNIIDKGEEYSALKKSFVIFICTFDPFKKDRYIYTFDRRCHEDDTIMLNDDATSIVLNCTGHIGSINDDLKDLLGYMTGQEPTSNFTKDIAKGVEEVHKSEKWRTEYMTLRMKLNEERKLGDLIRVISSVRKLRNKLDTQELMDTFELDSATLDSITDFIDEDPERSDEDIAELMLGY